MIASFTGFRPPLATLLVPHVAYKLICVFISVFATWATPVLETNFGKLE